MAKNLFKLSHYYANSYYLKVSEQMLQNVKENTQKYGSGYSNWLQLLSNFVGEYYEIAVRERMLCINLRKLTNITFQTN